MIRIQKLNEGLSPTLFHTTTIGKFIDIIKTNEFQTTTNLGTSADQIGSDKFYYFSTSHTYFGGYARTLPMDHIVTIQLDGRKLGQRYKGSPVDYWGPEFRQHATGEQKLRNDENEERIFTDDPEIPNALKYIEAVYMCLSDESGVPEDEAYIKAYEHPYSSQIREVARYLKNKGVDVYIFIDPKDFQSRNTRKSITDGLSRVLVRDLEAFVQIAENIEKFARGKEAENRDQRDLLQKLKRSGLDRSEIRVLNSDIHNARGSMGGRDLIHRLTKQLKRWKVKSIEQLAEKLNEYLSGAVQ